MQPARLVTIPFSHFCEKARWALDRAAIPYVEEPHLPLLHWRASLARARSKTVPVLVAEGEVLTDSTDILRWIDRTTGKADFFPAEVEAEVSRLEDLFDRRLGPAARRVAYFHLLPDSQATTALFSRSAEGWEKTAAPLLTRTLGKLIARGLKIDAKGADRSREAIEEVFAEVERLLGDGRTWLTGDRFTAADLAFAALASPIVFPPALERFGLVLDDAPLAMRQVVLRYRERDAGQLALRAYRDER